MREGGKLVRNMETWGRGAYRDGEGSMKKWGRGVYRDGGEYIEMSCEKITFLNIYLYQFFRFVL